MNALINDEIKSVIFSREAKRLNLHHNDEIIRRRLVQKYEFLIEDVAEGSEPTEEELDVFYEANANKYMSPAQTSFFHFYFKNTPTQEAKEAFELAVLDETNAKNVLEKMDHHDALHIDSWQPERSIHMISRSFGESFADQIKKFTTDGWISQPLRSGFGWHMVYIMNYEAPQLQAINSIKDQLIEDWKLAQGKDFTAKLYQNMRKKYEVTIEK